MRWSCNPPPALSVHSAASGQTRSMSWSGQWVGSSESSIACRPVCCRTGDSLYVR